MGVVIDVKGVSKKFKMPLDKQSGIKGTLISYLAGKAKYREFHALKDISLQVNKGDFIGIIGPNGSGKSTLLKIIAGIIKPDSGSVKVNGKISPFLELGLGFQGELSGIDNVYLYGVILGMTRKEIDRKYNRIVEFSGLKGFMNMPLKNYSSGMQVRLAFSVAIQASADILLIDEVLAVGDAEFQRKCLDYFDKIKGKKTVLFVSHDKKIVEMLSSRVITLNKQM